jgi:hypothetical protein
MKKIDFEELEKTKEYMETHYYMKKDASSQKEFYSINKFLVDYLQFLVD